MEMNGKTYTLDEIKQKMPKYDMFFAEKIQPGSQEDKLDKDPIATTNPNLHMRYDESEKTIRGEGELFDRVYTFLGRIGVKIYSARTRFLHDEEDTELSEIP